MSLGLLICFCHCNWLANCLASCHIQHSGSQYCHINFISIITPWASWGWLQTAYPMSLTWASDIANIILVGQQTLPHQSTISVCLNLEFKSKLTNLDTESILVTALFSMQESSPVITPQTQYKCLNVSWCLMCTCPRCVEEFSRWGSLHFGSWVGSIMVVCYY